MSNEENGIEKCCNRVNGCLERFFGGLGRKVSGLPVVVLLLTLTICTLLGVGMLNAKSTSELYDLWIEKGSRLIDERNFIEETFPSTSTRTSVLIYNPKEPIVKDPQSTKARDALERILELEVLLQTLEIEHKGQVYTYKDVCSRTPYPPSIKSLVIGQGGLPCTEFSPLMCFSEGDYNMWLDPGVQATFGLNSFSTNPSATGGAPIKKSFRNMTDAEIYEELKKPACTMWSNTRMPINLVAGDDQDKADHIPSLSIVLIKSSGANIGKTIGEKRAEQCKAQPLATCEQACTSKCPQIDEKLVVAPTSAPATPADCEDDPTGDVAKAGVTCGLLKGMGCSLDLSTVNPTTPKGTLTWHVCPKSCEQCTAWVKDFGGGAASAPAPAAAVCKDDPTGDVAKAGVTCGLLKGMGCSLDLSTVNPTTPKGTLTWHVCPESCEQCSAWVKDFGGGAAPAPAPAAAVCKDDPTGDVAKAGVTCGLLKGMGCSLDLSTVNPTTPKGTLTWHVCPESCEQCRAWLAQFAGGAAADAPTETPTASAEAPATAAVCKDDPTGDVAKAGVTCGLLKGMGCSLDLSTVNPTTPKGTLTWHVCPESCEQCRAWLAQFAGGAVGRRRLLSTDLAVDPAQYLSYLKATWNSRNIISFKFNLQHRRLRQGCVDDPTGEVKRQSVTCEALAQLNCTTLVKDLDPAANDVDTIATLCPKTCGNCVVEESVQESDSPCVDDPDGDIANAGVSCGLLAGMGCDIDINVLDPSAPVGTFVAMLCPVSCNTCPKTASESTDDGELPTTEPNSASASTAGVKSLIPDPECASKCPSQCVASCESDAVADTATLTADGETVVLAWEERMIHAMENLTKANQLLPETKTVWSQEVGKPMTPNDRVLKKNQKSFTNLVDNFEAINAGGELVYYAERSRSDLVKEASSADQVLILIGYLAMIAYACLSFFRLNPVESRCVVGLVGVILVIFSVLACLGLCALFGITFTPTIMQVLPFLAVGLGVDDMFVIAEAFTVNRKWTVGKMGETSLREAGASVAFTSVCNFIAFAVASTNPLPAVSSFSLAAMIVVAVNFFVIVLGFTAVAALDAKRQLDNRGDCWACCKSSTPAETETGENSESIYNKVGNSFAGALISFPGKVVTLVLFSALLGVSIYGATLAVVGLPLVDIVPKKHYASDFLRDREKYYHTWQGAITVGMDPETKKLLPQETVDWPNNLRRYLDLERELQADSLGFAAKVPIKDLAWPDVFVTFLNTHDTFPTGAFDIEKLDAKYGPNCRGVGPACTATKEQTEVEYVEMGERKKRGLGDFYYSGLGYLPDNDPEIFWDRFKNWITTYGVPQSTQVIVDDDFRIVASQITAMEEHMINATNSIKHISESRVITDAANEQGLPAFPSGFVFNFYEQYVSVESSLASSLWQVALAVFIVSHLFLFHPGAVFIMCSVIAFVVIEVYGFLEFVGLKVNGVCVVNLVMAVGVSVEFTAHITRIFMTAKGTRDERAKKALTTMFAPTLNGALSTFIGVLPMGFAQFPYFQLYFFRQYVLIIVFGFLNGIALLPVLLSLVGPAPVKTTELDSEEATCAKCGLAKIDGDKFCGHCGASFEGTALAKGADPEQPATEDQPMLATETGETV